MAGSDPIAWTVVLLENVPLFSKNTDKKTIQVTCIIVYSGVMITFCSLCQKALIEFGYHRKLTNIMSVSPVGGEGERSGALYKLYGSKCFVQHIQT